MHRQHNACNVNYVQCCLIHCPHIFLKFKSISYSKDSVQWCIQFATVISLSGWFIGLSCQSSRDKLRCRLHLIHQAWTKQFHVTDGYLIMFRILYQKTPVVIAVEILLIHICILYVSYLIVNVYPGMPTLGEQQHPFWMLHTFISEHQNWISSIIYIYICVCVCVLLLLLLRYMVLSSMVIFGWKNGLFHWNRCQIWWALCVWMNKSTECLPTETNDRNSADGPTPYYRGEWTYEHSDPNHYNHDPMRSIISFVSLWICPVYHAVSDTEW